MLNRNWSDVLAEFKLAIQSGWIRWVSLKGREQLMQTQEKKKRGFAAMDPEKQRSIARLGGVKVSRDREHMAKIGKKGGSA